MRRKIVMLGATPRTQRSHSSVQLPTDFSSSASSVPLFLYSTSDFIFDARQDSSSSTSGKTSLHALLCEEWESSRQKNAINYNLNCLYKYLEGPFNLTIQLNVERGELRRKPMRFRKISEPFNAVRWNFTRLHQNEIMMYLKCEDRPLSSDPLDRHIIAVNASPIERNHSLVIPAVNKCHPQVLNEMALRLAVDTMLLIPHPNHHILFNSLLGQASVNHLHLHSCSWPYDSDLINRRFESIPNMDKVYVIRPQDWICHALAFQLEDMQQFDVFLRQLKKCVEVLLWREQAHNLFLSRAPPIRTEGELREEDRRGERPLLVTAYVFPRLNITGAKPPTSFNPAAAELAGLLTSYTWRFFESVTEQSAVRIVEEDAVLPEHVFDSLVADIAESLQGGPSHAPPRELPLPEGLTSPEMDELRDQFSSFAPPSPSRIHIRPRTHSQGESTSRSVRETSPRKQSVPPKIVLT